MNQQNFLYGQDYLSQTPQDIQELILYETSPENIDTLCQINENLTLLCQNPRIIDNYLEKYNLQIPIPKNKYDLEFINSIVNIMNTNSITLITYVLSKILSLYGREYLLYKTSFSDSIAKLIDKKFIADINIIKILSILIPIFNESFAYRVTYRAVINNRNQLIQWLKDNNDYLHRAALEASIEAHKYDEFNQILNYMLANQIFINWGALIIDSIKYGNPYVLDQLIKLNNNDIYKLLKDSESSFILAMEDIIEKLKYDADINRYRMMIDLIYDYLHPYD